MKEINILLKNFLADVAILIDRNRSFSYDEVKKQLEDGNIYFWLKEKNDIDNLFNIDDNEDINKLNEKLSRTARNYSKKSGIENMGLPLVISLISVAIKTEEIEWYIEVTNGIISLIDKQDLKDKGNKILKYFTQCLNREMVALQNEDFDYLADLLEVEMVKFLDELSDFNQKLLEEN